MAKKNNKKSNPNASGVNSSRRIRKSELTGLKNRNSLLKDIENNKKPYTCLAIFDIDYFKDINDYFGFESGDLLINKVSSIINEYINLPEFGDYKLYHLSIDEFALICATNDISEKEHFILTCSNIIEEIEDTTIKLSNDNTVDVNLSAGLSYGTEPLRILKEASTALAYSKKHTLHLTDFNLVESLKNQSYEKMFWFEELKKIISKKGIIPWVQPIVDNRTGKIVKVEVLMRAVNSKGKIIAPGYFLEVAKATRLYEKVSFILIKKTLIAFTGISTHFNLNLSWEDVKSPKTIKMILDILVENPELGKRMTIEIVETESIENFKTFNAFLSKVRKHGVKIALDDFGSGYSNFVYLDKMNVDILKIDGSLIRNLTNQKTTRIVRAILEIAKTFDVETVAEFVSNEKVFKEVKKLGIDFSQGYFFHKPMPIEEFLAIG